MRHQKTTSSKLMKLKPAQRVVFEVSGRFCTREHRVREREREREGEREESALPQAGSLPGFTRVVK